CSSDLPKRYHVEEICFSEDYYDLNYQISKKGNVQADIIEKQAFWYEKNKYIEKAVGALTNRKVSRNDIEKLIGFMLSLKQRNPHFRNGYSNLDTQPILQNSIEKVYKKFANDSNKEKIKEIIDRILKELDKDESLKPENMHKNSLFSAMNGDNLSFDEV